jgi:hypothetical protein
MVGRVCLPRLIVVPMSTGDDKGCGFDPEAGTVDGGVSISESIVMDERGQDGGEFSNGCGGRVPAIERNDCGKGNRDGPRPRRSWTGGFEGSISDAITTRYFYYSVHARERDRRPS